MVPRASLRPSTPASVLPTRLRRRSSILNLVALGMSLPTATTPSSPRLFLSSTSFKCVTSLHGKPAPRASHPAAVMPVSINERSRSTTACGKSWVTLTTSTGLCPSKPRHRVVRPESLKAEAIKSTYLPLASAARYIPAAKRPRSKRFKASNFSSSIGMSALRSLEHTMAFKMWTRSDSTLAWAFCTSVASASCVTSWGKFISRSALRPTH
mmetsp:Transcript_67953/g.210185  ORF Transcript_67953/g.210185 Transcript_67953/m.210185 type:complete len:211 (-) Transcript_67953:1018-1650(-)